MTRTPPLTRPSSSWSSSRSSRRPSGRRLALPALALTIAALASACSSGGGSGSTASSDTSGSGSGAIATRSTSVGTVLTDGAGQTMYAFAADKKGVSHCSGSCLTYWPPVSASAAPKAAADVTAHLGTITGTDGQKQLTVDGWPMYTYVGDSNPGDTTGQGLDESGGLWWVVAPDGTWIKGSGSTSSGSSSSSSDQGNGMSY
jgi:predicted lipoprotein with Yx(FWY)xxD motif